MCRNHKNLLVIELQIRKKMSVFLVSDLSSFNTFFTVESAKPDLLAYCSHSSSCENTLSCFCAALLRRVLSSQSEILCLYSCFRPCCFVVDLLWFSLPPSPCFKAPMGQRAYARLRLSRYCQATVMTDFTANLLLIEKILNEVQPKVYISVPFESTYLYDDNCWICKYSESRRLI